MREKRESVSEVRKKGEQFKSARKKGGGERNNSMGTKKFHYLEFFNK